MKQYVREYNGQMAYFDGQSTFELLDGVPFINLDISQLISDLSWAKNNFVSDDVSTACASAFS